MVRAEPQTLKFVQVASRKPGASPPIRIAPGRGCRHCRLTVTHADYNRKCAGVITPSISVLSAVGGLGNIPPPAGTNVTQNIVVGVSCAILALLFLFQYFGTKKIGMSFAPIIVVWLLFNLVIGIYNINVYGANIFRCVNPGARPRKGLVLVGAARADICDTFICALLPARLRVAFAKKAATV